MDQNEKCLLSIRDEMENVRELYIKGYIDKRTYQEETRTLLKWLQVMVLEKKNINQIKKSIEKFNEFSLKEKASLTDSIEMLWLNAGIQRKNKILDLSKERMNKF